MEKYSLLTKLAKCTLNIVLKLTFNVYLFRLRVVPQFYSGTSPFLAWGDFHARSRFAGSTIVRKNGGLLVLYFLLFFVF